MWCGWLTPTTYFQLAEAGSINEPVKWHNIYNVSGPSSTNREPETPVSNSSSTQQTGSEGGGGGRPGGANEGSQSSTSDDDTPATRRQRLDSEFVDLDFD